ncbi:beta-2-microglobulin-like [Acanthopagrus latus]|uniref:beta-2-microglobulin-like n=1 Tax=Acanthopagrus latus TaxID=8177 RepID=UPI00187C79C7|nr:beta-2-microglobulin-like [Acanthopagrus latus]
MRTVFFLAALAVVYCSDNSKYSPPKVQVYTAGPGEFGVKNILICHVSGFHPPDITIQLMKDGEELSNANQTDLAFKSDWHFHLTKNVAFTPTRGQQFSCKVTHGANMREYVWVPNM